MSELTSNDRVLAMIRERLNLGQERYGQDIPLKGEGGRDNFKESIEEALDMSIYLTATLLESSDKKTDENKSERKTWQKDEVILILSGLHKLYSSKYAENQLDLCTKIDDIIKTIKEATKWSEDDEKMLII